MTADPSDLSVPFQRPSANEKPAVAPGRPAALAFAVHYQGEFETPWDGTAVAVRAHARALAATGIPVFLKSFSNSLTDEHGVIQPVHQIGLPESVEKEVGHLTRIKASAGFPRILHLVVRDAEHLKRAVISRGVISFGASEDERFENEQGMRKQIYDSTIVYSVWERDRIDPGIVRTLSRVAECWVPSEDNRRMLIRSGVPEEKVVVVPHPYDLDSEVLKLRKRSPVKQRRFYSIGRWEPRKAYAELVEAFLRAYRPEDDATLTIKYTGGKWPGYPTPEEVIAWCTSDPELVSRGWTKEAFDRRVTLYEGRFPRQEILRLHFQNNLYVACSRGEAWCLPAFEAALAGNKILATETGASDFMGAGDVSLVNGLAPVPASYGWEPDAKWLGFSTAELSDLLRGVAAPESHSGRDLSRFWLGAVGTIMRERVLKVAAGHPEVLKAWGLE